MQPLARLTVGSGGDGGGWACFAAEPSERRGAIGCRPDIESSGCGATTPAQLLGLLFPRPPATARAAAAAAAAAAENENRAIERGAQKKHAHVTYGVRGQPRVKNMLR